MPATSLPRPLRFPCWRILRKTAAMLPWNKCAPAPPIDDGYGAGLTAADAAADLVWTIINGNRGNPNDRSTAEMRRACITIRWRFVRHMLADEREWVRRSVISKLARRSKVEARAKLQKITRVTPQFAPGEGIRDVPLYADIQLTENELYQLNVSKRWYWQCCSNYAHTLSEGDFQSRVLAYENYHALCDRLAGIVRLPLAEGDAWPGKRDPRYIPRCTNAHIDGFADRFNWSFKLPRRDDL